ncbi:MAG TPA: DUF2891 domain-containing protein [Pseudonocardiaceae bacterium]
MTTLDEPTIAGLLATAVANVRREYPVHWTHHIHSAEELVPQRVLHPVFAGSYDWHSCVHQTWLAVRLLRLYPRAEGAEIAVSTLDELVTAEGCAVEAEFFRSPAGAYWERPYGWAWLLLLDAELRHWVRHDPNHEWSAAAARWQAALRPLAEVVRSRFLTWLPSARFPVRAGVHSNTAFALGLVLDAARSGEDTELAAACERAAQRWYCADENYGGFEPDAVDFLSPALVEADLMRRVLDRDAFTAWFERFLPDLDQARWTVLREPVPVDDPADPLGSHLAGLALSRAWCWKAVAAALPTDHRFASLARTAARQHTEYGLRYVFGHGYAAEHWLGTFAAYLELGALATG